MAVDGLERNKQYDFEARNVSACGAMSVWVPSDYAVPDVPVGTLTLVAMQQGINDAAGDAAAANAELADIASDNILSPAEKPTVMRDYSVITSEQAGIDTQATQYGITTQKSDYDNAISTLTAYLNTLNSPVAWNNKSGNTTITGSTFRGYFNSVYTTRQVLLNAIYATAKGLADNAQSTASTAQGTANTIDNSRAVPNPDFELGDTGWFKEIGWSIVGDGAHSFSGQWYAQRVGRGVADNLSIYGTNLTPCQPGQQFTAQGMCAASGADGVCGVSLRFFNAAKNYIGYAYGNTITGSAGYTLTRVTKPMPAGTAFVCASFSVLNHVNGTYWCDKAQLSSAPTSLAEIPDDTSSGRFAAIESGADKTSGKPLSSLSGRTMDYIGDSATRFAAAQAGADKTGSNPQGSTWLTDSANMARGGDSITRFGGRTLDNIGDSTGYARTKASVLQNGIPMQVSAGRNLVFNGGFELNDTNTRYGDGWLDPNGITIFGFVRATGVSGAPSPNVMQYNLAPGTVIPTGSVFDGLSCARPVDVHIGDTIYLQADFQNSSNTALPAGITVSLSIAVLFMNASGGVIGQVSVVAPFAGAWKTVTAVGVVPSGTQSATLQPLIYVSNTTGAAWTVPAGQYPAFGFFDNIAAYVVDELRIPGSGVTVGDQRNLLPVTWAGVRSVLSTSPISFSISGTTVNFSVAAFTLQGGGISVSYNASSGSVAQTAGTTVTYYLYYRDATASGGSKSLYISTSPQSLAAYPDIVMLGTADVTVASGGGGSGGTGGGGGGFCVGDEMFIRDGLRAGDSDIGDPFDCIDLPTAAGKHQRALQGVERYIGERIRLITDKGAALVCGIDTPFDLPDGREVLAVHMLGEKVITDWGVETVTSAALTGPGPLTRNHLGGVSYAAGADPQHRIYSHNGSIAKP